jgi:hypothetical protein
VVGVDDRVPRPRAISARLTGNAAQNAMKSPTPRLHQKRKFPSPASIAPGTSRMKALSTISITAIDTVSAARATRAALRNCTPPVTSGRRVSR